MRGDELEMDFTGSDPQVASSLNVPTGGDGHHSVITVGLIYVMHTLAPRNVLNAGSVRPMRAVLPERGPSSIRRAPAAVGMRSLTAAVIQACTFGVFNRALPDRLPACPAGRPLPAEREDRRRASGRQVLSSIGPCGGGGRRRAGIRRRRGLRREQRLPEEHAGGNQRGAKCPSRSSATAWCRTPAARAGCAAATPPRWNSSVLAPNGVVTARNRNRSELAAWGVVGGKAGAELALHQEPRRPRAGGTAQQRSGELRAGRRRSACKVRPEAAMATLRSAPWRKSWTMCAAASFRRPRARHAYGVAVRDDMTVDQAATRASCARPGWARYPRWS